MKFAVLPLTLTAVLVAVPAPASPPVVYTQPQYVVPQYAPAYGVQYPDPAELAAAVKELSAEVRQLREALGLRGGEPVPLKAPLPKEVGLLRANCAGCHSGTAAKGAGHVFDFDNLTPATLKLFAREVLEGRMPKGKVLDDKTRTALVLACFDPKK